MNKNKTTFIVIIITLLVFILSACGAEETPAPVVQESLGPDYVIAEGHVVPIKDGWLSFLTQGRVTEIMIEEGESVLGDQALIQLADQESALASLEAAELELLSAQQAYDDFLRTADLSAAGAWQAYQNAQILRAELEKDWEDLNLEFLEEEVDDALVEVRDREEDLDDAREEWEKYQDIDEDNFNRQAAEDDLERAEEDYAQALRDLEEAQREIDGPRAALDAALAAEAEALREYEMWVEDGFDLDQQQLLEARLATAEASLAAAEKALDNYTLKAPFSGTVTDIYIEVGQLVGPEFRVARLADLSEFQIETSDLTELEVVRVQEGQLVEIVPDALPGTTLTGKVYDISQSFTTQAGDIIYNVTISLDEPNPGLRWGMTVELTFLPE